jgi:hypothetical protein
MLAYMNRGVGNSSQELVISQARQSQKLDVQELITYDFPKIGYDFNDTLSTKVVSGSSSKIVFRSNLDNSADGSIETVTWELTAEPVTGTPNENDVILRRTVDADVTDVLLGVTRFEISYYSANNTVLSTPLSASDINNLRQVEITLEMQSAEKVTTTYSTGSDYIRTVWNKRFTPRNLTVNL